MATYKGIYKPINPQKYRGDPTNIVMRSSWETKFAIWCDTNPAVIKWNSEETVIPYVSPVDNKAHRYFVDFLVTLINKEGKKETLLIEIKPKLQSTITERQSQRDRAQVAINYAKWDAATKWCKQQGLTFRVINEDQIFHQGGKK